jgi:hypothetical protein
MWGMFVSNHRTFPCRRSLKVRTDAGRTFGLYPEELLFAIFQTGRK